MITFEFGEFEFEGVKLKKNEEYPWKNNKEKIKLFNELIEEKNKEQAIRLLKKESIELIHINLSKSAITSTMSIVCAILMALTLSIFTFTQTIILGGIGFLLLFMKYIYERKAKHIFINLKLDIFMINEVLSKT